VSNGDDKGYIAMPGSVAEELFYPPKEQINESTKNKNGMVFP
jgi:hypothetical protein